MTFNHFYFEVAAPQHSSSGPQRDAEVTQETFNVCDPLPPLSPVDDRSPFAMSGLEQARSYGATTGMISAVGLPFAPLAFPAVAIELGVPASHAGYRAAMGRGLALCSLRRRCRLRPTSRIKPDDPLPQERDDAAGFCRSRIRRVHSASTIGQRQRWLSVQ